ncbi:MAG: tetratricopeptide repeat protein [Bacillota bacterium]|nr:tetratricopeptide repeat protein [Bacillota bacterium]
MNNRLARTVLFLILPIVLLIIGFKTSILAGLCVFVLYILLGLIFARPLIYTAIGNSKYAKKDLTGALKWYKKASQQKGAALQIKIYYGYLLLKSGNVEEAENELAPLLELNISEVQKNSVRSNLALVYWKKGNIDQAIVTLEEVISNQKATTIYGSLGYMYILKGDLDKAVAFNKEAYEFNSDNPAILDNLGQSYFLRGEYEKSAEIYERLIPMKPTFPDAYYNYALLLDSKGNYEDAYYYLQKALRCKPSFLSSLTFKEIEAKSEEMCEKAKQAQ